MRLLRRVPWWAWLVLPGGAVLALLSKRSGGSTPTLTPLTQDGLDHNVQTSVERQIQAAKTAADTLRTGLGTDALAAKFLNIDPSLLKTPAQSADINQEADGLRAQIADEVAQEAAQQARYQFNHDGGQSVEQEQNIQGTFEGAIAALQAKLGALLAKVTGG